MTLVIVFKTGYELKMKCKSYEINKDGYGRIKKMSFEGITENIPLYWNAEDVLCVYRVASDEIKESEGE